MSSGSSDPAEPLQICAFCGFSIAEDGQRCHPRRREVHGVMPQCDNCGAHVSAAFKRTRSDNAGTPHGCPVCISPATRVRDCAGVESAYQTRSDPDGATIGTDGGER